MDAVFTPPRSPPSQSSPERTQCTAQSSSTAQQTLVKQTSSAQTNSSPNLRSAFVCGIMGDLSCSRAAVVWHHKLSHLERVQGRLLLVGGGMAGDYVTATWPLSSPSVIPKTVCCQLRCVPNSSSHLICKGVTDLPSWIYQRKDFLSSFGDRKEHVHRKPSNALTEFCFTVVWTLMVLTLLYLRYTRLWLMLTSERRC